MFKKKNESPIQSLNQQEISTIIGTDCEIEGDLKSKSSARIEGKISGNVYMTKGVVLGEQGLVIGNLETESAIIFGTVNGNVKVKHLEIKKTGVISGDVKTEYLVIEMGGTYNGKLEMKSNNQKVNHPKLEKKDKIEV